MDKDSQPLSGAEFTLYANTSGSEEPIVIRKGTTNDNGELTLRVIPIGNYILKETVAPDGYSLSYTEYQVTITQGADGVESTIEPNDRGPADAPNEITIKNFKDEDLGSLTIKKLIDEKDKEDANEEMQFEFTVTFTGDVLDPSASYPYDLYDESGEGVVSSGMISNGGSVYLTIGQSVTIKDIPVDAVYTVEETDHSSDGYVVQEAETGIIEENQDATGALISNATIVEFTNELIRGNIILRKTDESEEPLNGAKFGLYVANSNWGLDSGAEPIATAISGEIPDGFKIDGELVSDSTGWVVFAGFPFGQYIIKEISAPTGYQFSESEDELRATISGDSLAVDLGDIVNKKIKGSLQILKVRTGTDTPLAGAEFILYDADDQVIGDPVVTDADGQAVFTDLVFGNYTFKETKAPGGYYSNDTVYELNIPDVMEDEDYEVVSEGDENLTDGFVIKKTIENRKKPSGGGTPTPDPKDPTIVKDVNGTSHVTLEKYQDDFTYNVKVAIPEDVTGYNKLLIYDDLEKVLAVKSLEVLVDGVRDVGLTESVKIVDNRVSLTLDNKYRYSTIAGKTITLVINTELKANADLSVYTNKLIPNQAAFSLNDNSGVDSNRVTVTVPKDPTSPGDLEEGGGEDPGGKDPTSPGGMESGEFEGSDGKDPTSPGGLESGEFSQPDDKKPGLPATGTDNTLPYLFSILGLTFLALGVVLFRRTKYASDK